MAVKFSTKAGTLEALQSVVKSARIAPLIFFNVRDWTKNQNDVLTRTIEKLGSGPWIVRSSSGREDGELQSNAGAFLSIQNVSSKAGLRNAIDRVIESYGRAEPLDEILVQPMLKGVCRSGVAFSHDPNTCAPYRVISWSDTSDTSVVTGGLGGKVWQTIACNKNHYEEKFSPIITLIEELLELFQQKPIDCEFAITLERGTEFLWLLQARPLVLLKKPEQNLVQMKRTKLIEAKVAKGMAAHPFLMGRRTVYGVMPDWNPAEIIGIRPKPLALSLYKDLITDSIWAYQRNNYGYRNLRSFPLLVNFFGLPYIDVRLSFNSFIPADLDKDVAGRLVDYYMDRLLDEPTLHDKVEFEIVFSCYTLDLPDRLERLREAGFSRGERNTIASSLRSLTNRIVHPKTGLWRRDSEKLKTLQARHAELITSDSDTIGKIYWLLEDAKRYGTLPFAGLARAGFIAVQMLRSLVNVGVFSEADYDAFIGGVSTVSGQLANDRITLNKGAFLAKYGHLRPGTYDILSPRYDEEPDIYFDWNRPVAVQKSTQPFSITLAQIREVGSLLKSHNLEADPVELFDFISAGIEQRELAKFHFTKNLSDALALFKQFGDSLGFALEDLAFCDVGTIQELYSAAEEPKAALARSIEKGKARYEETVRVSLPPIISSPRDVRSFYWPESQPNFITQKQVNAPVVDYKNKERLAGAIVCVPNADPGFDWLFSYPISGLITAWGGANSHMAIRAGELGLPAVVGSGESLYNRWTSSKKIHLDCAGRRVEILE